MTSHPAPILTVTARLLDAAHDVPGLHPDWQRIAARTTLVGTDAFDAAAAEDENWIGDLGLRPSTTPTEFFQHGARQVLVHLPDPAAVFAELPARDDATTQLALAAGFELDGPVADHVGIAELALTSPRNAVHVLTTLVNHLGAWNDAVRISLLVHERRAEIDATDDGARVLSLAANLLAGVGDGRCRDMYALAAATWTHPTCRFFAHLRAAVAEVKRLAAPDRVPAALDAVDSAADAVAHAGYIGDAAAARAIVANLRALVHVKDKDADAAEASVRRAWELLTPELATSDRLTEQMIDEFRIQVLANLGLVLGMRRGWEHALERFEFADGIAHRQSRPGFRVETATLVGYALVRLERHREALGVLLDAERTAARDVAPIRQRHVWKLLAAAADGAGETELADTWLERLAAA